MLNARLPGETVRRADRLGESVTPAAGDDRFAGSFNIAHMPGRYKQRSHSGACSENSANDLKVWILEFGFWIVNCFYIAPNIIIIIIIIIIIRIGVSL